MKKTTIRLNDELFVLAMDLSKVTDRSLSETVVGLAGAGLAARMATMGGLSDQSRHILQVIDDLPDPVSVEDLAASTHLSTNVIGGTVGVFERSGWATLGKKDGAGGWRTVVTLTPEGRELSRLAMLTAQRRNGVR